MQDTRRGTREAEELDPVWRALSNPDRRRMLDLLMEGPLTTGALVEEFPEISRFAVMQHLKVLKVANLITAIRRGRQRPGIAVALCRHRAVGRRQDRVGADDGPAGRAVRRQDFGW